MSAILRPGPTLLISRRLTDPHGSVYRREAEDKNIIILPHVIALSKVGRGQGGFSRSLRSQGKWIS